MPFPFDKYPWLNFQELNLAYFIIHFREIFQQWDQLYHDLLDWKDATDADLAEWKTAVESGISSWETGLTAALEVWKSETESGLDAWKTQTESDINTWEAATLAALEAWKTATTAVFEQIRTEAAASATAAAGSASSAQTALAGAQAAQTAAETAAAQISNSLAQITTNAKGVAILRDKTNIINGFTVTWETGYRSLETATFDINTVIENENYITCKFPVQRGDKIYITGYGLNPARLLGIADADGNKIATSTTNQRWENHAYTCPANAAWAVVNSLASNNYDAYILKTSNRLDALASDIASINTLLATVEARSAKTADELQIFNPHALPNIILLGDSITMGTGSSDFSETGDPIPGTGDPPRQRNTGTKAWGAQMVTLLNTQYGANCVNNGVGGWKTYQITQNLDDVCPDSAQMVILTVGTNDRGYTYTQMSTYAGALLDALIAKGVKVFVFSPMPDNLNSPPTTSLAKINNIWMEQAKTRGIPFHSLYADFNAYVSTHADSYASYFSDQLHPNDKGYTVLFSIYRQALMI